LDHSICENVIETYLREKVDFVHTGPTFADGLDCEIVSFEAIENAKNKSKLKSEREHVTLYLKKHFLDYHIVEIQNKTDDGKYRFTHDEADDFDVIETIIKELSQDGSTIFKSERIKEFLD
jgi:spore coat polysaccharide biosynthesis protein SpsF